MIMLYRIALYLQLYPQFQNDEFLVYKSLFDAKISESYTYRESYLHINLNIKIEKNWCIYK